jgi:hypothetical protein
MTVRRPGCDFGCMNTSVCSRYYLVCVGLFNNLRNVGNDLRGNKLAKFLAKIKHR